MEVSTRPSTVSQGNRFVIEDDDDGGVKVADVSDDEVWSAEEEEEEEEEEDVVKKALRKCEKISAELKQELYGTTAVACDRYSEVELGSSAARIVTQDEVTEACGSGDLDFEPTLKPYQLIGVNFLMLLYRKKIGGAILADEMGLGKTVQLTLLKHLEDDPGPHLIVCPASVLENWERELKKWCPTFSVLQYHGSARAAYSKQLSSLGKAGHPPPFAVILVCYSLFERHSLQQKDDHKILRHWKWSCVIMDEAHALKDKNSYRWKNLMSVARTARQRLMLAGTPLQNDLHELWLLLEFMMPDLFETGDIDLKKLLNAEDKDLISRMKSILGPFILRRLKSDVMQQLVPKLQKTEYVRMGKRQEDAYKEAIENYRAISQACIMKSSETSVHNVANILPRHQISNYFLEFRKIANHPLLVRRIYNDDDVVRFAKMLHPKGVFGYECTLERVIEELKSYNDFSQIFFKNNKKTIKPTSQNFQIFFQSPDLGIPARALILQNPNPDLTLNDLKSSLFPTNSIPRGSFFFTLNGKPLSDSISLLRNHVLAPFSTLTLHLRFHGGGGDGGATGAESRDCYLNMYAVKKPDKVDPNEMRLSKCLNCSLSNEPLTHPVVLHKLGNLFNKEALVEGLLMKNLPKEFWYIKGLKNMIPVELTEIPKAKEIGDVRFQCPITGLEFNGKNKFYAIKTCGHVMSAKGFKEVKSSACLICHKEFVESDKIVVNGTEEVVKELWEKVKEEKAKVKGNGKKSKKLKTGDENGKEVRVLSGTKHVIVGNGMQTDGKGSSKKFKAAMTAPANATKEVYASIFTSSKKSDFKETYSCRSLPLGRN